jgi:hypothetical protein
MVRRIQTEARVAVLLTSLALLSPAWTSAERMNPASASTTASEPYSVARVTHAFATAGIDLDYTGGDPDMQTLSERSPMPLQKLGVLSVVFRTVKGAREFFPLLRANPRTKGLPVVREANVIVTLVRLTPSRVAIRSLPRAARLALNILAAHRLA